MGKLVGLTRTRRQDERGAVTTEVALLVPIVLFVAMVFMQTVLWIHASNVAQIGAAQALEAATAYAPGGVGLGEGETVGMAFLDAAGGIGSPVVTVSDGPGNTRVVVVTGTALQLIPRGAWPVEVTVEAPIERYVEVSPE